jgi:hypothetical protein
MQTIRYLSAEANGLKISYREAGRTDVAAPGLVVDIIREAIGEAISG